MSRYISTVGRFYKEESLCFEFQLLRGANAVWCKDYDIEMYVYTSELSPRLRVCDYREGFVKEVFRFVPHCGAEIVKGRNTYYVKLSPMFLKALPTGVLTFGIRYIGDGFESAEILRTSPFSSIRL